MLTNKTDVKAILGISDNSQDTLIENLILEVDELIKSYCNREFEYNTYTHTEFIKDVENPIFLVETPIDSIEKFYINTDEKDLAYTINKESGVMYLGYTTILNNNSSLTEDIFKIEYKGGYETIPAGLISIANDFVVYKYYKSGKDNSIESEKIDSLSIKYNNKNIEDSIFKKLNMYKRIKL